MNIFDIMGPIMVGPSSSHTAGAVRMGRVARHLLGSQPVRAEIQLHGSFAATGAGHGTDRAIVAGLLDLTPDDPAIPHSLQLAQKAGMEISIRPVELRGAHPNTAILDLTNGEGRTLSVSASSLGGGRIRVNAIDGMEASFSGDYPTLIIRNEDKPGIVSEVSYALSRRNANIATMQLYRDRRGGLAVMVIECDAPVPAAVREELAGLDGVVRCTYLDLGGN
ncbi:MAG: L-serine ammonia-lyase, iron-sulfur-dependent subunit beta [Candidatus Enterenecus sp.]